MKVLFDANGGRAEGYLAAPAEGRGPGVLVLQEWWGLVPHIEDVCDRFPREGFTALAPYLYPGERTKDPDTAGRLMMALEVPNVAADLRGALDALRAHPTCASSKVGTVGFCLGGQLALFAACLHPDAVGACVDFYGIHPKITPDLGRLQAPVLGLFAEKDEFVPPATVADLSQRLREAGKEHEFHTYPGVGHAFFNDTRRDAYDATAAADAWHRTLRFFRQNVNDSLEA